MGAATRAWIARLALAALAGAALTLAFAEVRWSWLAWVALVPLIGVVKQTGPAGGYLAGGLAGLVFFAGTFSWIWAVPGFNVLAFAVLELYFAQYLALFGLLLGLVAHRTRVPATLAAPVLWTSLEYLRSNLAFLALPMALLGHTQHDRLAVIQVASVTGVYGVSFLVVLVNAGLADLLDRLAAAPTSPAASRWVHLGLPLAASVLAPAAATLWGVHVLAAPEGERITVGVLQTDLPPRLSLDARSRRLDGYIALSRRLADDRPALIVWPETAVPGPLPALPDLLDPIAGLARDVGGSILVGSAGSRKFAPAGGSGEASFNSAALVSPRGAVEGSYHKIRLVPFGEYRPLAGIFAWPEWLVGDDGDHLTAGTDPTVLPLPAARFGVVICWESLFPDLVGALVRRGADFVVNITNEAWFGTTAAPERLAAISAFRAVEHRIALVRAANGGISGFIDPHGRITGTVRAGARPGGYGEGVLAQPIALPRRPTFYTRHGDAAAHLCLALAAVVVGLAVRAGAATAP